MFVYLKLSLGWLPPQDRRIYLSDSDFVNITQNGTLCNANGEIGLAEFHAIMRREVTLGQAIAGQGIGEVVGVRDMQTENVSKQRVWAQFCSLGLLSDH